MSSAPSNPGAPSQAYPPVHPMRQLTDVDNNNIPSELYPRLTRSGSTDPTKFSYRRCNRAGQLSEVGRGTPVEQSIEYGCTDTQISIHTLLPPYPATGEAGGTMGAPPAPGAAPAPTGPSSAPVNSNQAGLAPNSTSATSNTAGTAPGSALSIESYPSPALYTFPVDITVADLLRRHEFLVALLRTSLYAARNNAAHAPELNATQITPYFTVSTGVQPAAGIQNTPPPKNLPAGVSTYDANSTKSVAELLREPNKLSLTLQTPQGSTILHFHPTRQPTINSNFHKQGLAKRLPLAGDGSRPDAESIADADDYPNQSLDLLGDTLHGDLTYLLEFVKSHIGSKVPFPVYPAMSNGRVPEGSVDGSQNGIYRLGGDSNGDIRISLVSDWAAGTKEAALIAQAMMRGYQPHYSIHLGDVYYVGLPAEIRANCLGEKPTHAKRGVSWPHGSLGSLAITGNHEMYSRGEGFFGTWLPTLGVVNNPQSPSGSRTPQIASFWCIEDTNWRIIGLDTGYESFSLDSIDNARVSLPAQIITWLRDVIKLSPNMEDKRGLVFLSHHQPLTAWQKQTNYTFQSEIAKLLPDNRTVLWLFGHEHRLSFYDKQTITTSDNGKMTLYARCVGNSGFPNIAGELPQTARQSNLIAYDDRLYAVEKGAWGNVPLTFNGYAQLTLHPPTKKNLPTRHGPSFASPVEPTQTDNIAPTLTISYHSLSLVNGQVSDSDPVLLLEESFGVTPDGSVLLQHWDCVNPEITRTVHVDPKNANR